MGLFDTVWMTCPHCGERTSEQTKVGPCHMLNLTLNDHDGMAWDLSTQGVLRCDACGKGFRVVKARYVTERADLIPPDPDDEEKE